MSKRRGTVSSVILKHCFLFKAFRHQAINNLRTKAGVFFAPVIKVLSKSFFS